MLLQTIFLIGLPGSLAALWNTFDEWPTVDKLDIYLNLTSCAQPCVRNVNQQIIIDGRNCETCGCVCSESTLGQNFINGLSNVTECARKACPSAADVNAAELAYEDICLVYAASSSRPNETEGSEILRITSDGYANLTDCAKFALNGCLNKNGTRNEANCGPVNKYENWEEYRGVAAQRQCKTSECLCKQPKFDASFAVAFDAGESYCGMWLSTAGRKNEEYEKMQNVLATYCASEAYPPKNWAIQIIGQPQGSNGTTTNNTKNDESNQDDEWTLSNKLQIGLGLGLGFPALVINFALLILAFRQYRSVKTV